ncbi:MAG: KH domain-containing protein [Candidatus Thorarchaeota archaeon]|nr:MAG: RNA-processing protein [Candidatus Thorarchaeota archaeon]
MMYHETIKVPSDRVGVIVGRNGRVRRRVEELTNTKIEVNSEGIVTITRPTETEDPVLAWKARDIVRAMARGFSPKRALSLIDEDVRLIVISLRNYVGSSPNQLKRVAGRIIGENGRTRKVIEQTTDTKISVYGKTVSIIGSDPGLDYAQRAVDMLIQGAPHNAVYSRLERMRRQMNRQQAELWEPTEL